MIHSSKTAYVAVADHRDASGAFKAGDIVIVSEPALVAALVREGSIDPSVVVGASLFTPGAATASAELKATDGQPPKSSAESANRMVTRSRTRGRPAAPAVDPADAGAEAAGAELAEDDGHGEGEVGGAG